MNWLWQYKGVDWLGMILAAVSLFYLGRHRKIGFLLGLGCNVSWLFFGIMTESVANILANVLYMGFNIRGWRRWKDDQSSCPNA